MGIFIQTLRNLGPMRLAIMGGIGLGLIIFFVVLTSRLAAPQMALLFGDLSSDDAGRITTALQSRGVPFEARQNGRQIFVPEDQALRLRVALAEQGMPGGGSLGYEIFDRSDTLGTTNFVQNINLVRALEGELARTIRAIQGVRTARVHLVMPRRELFSRERQEPSASVVLAMGGAGRLGPGQVMAIQHLVAAAVPDLAPNRISIVDERGTLLARGFDDPLGAGVAARAEEMRRETERRMARSVEELIEKTVGYGKVRVELSAEMDFDRINTSEEVFDPEGQVVRSTQTIDNQSSSQEGETPPVTVATNLPDANAAAGGASANSRETRTEETVNYEITKRVVNHVREVGSVKRLSMAVLVDGTYTGEGANRAYQPRDDQEMQLIATLARSSVGFSAQRGDTVEVVNMRFAPPEAATEEPLALFLGLGKNDVLRMAEILVLSIVAVLVILLVVRPLLARAFEALPSLGGAGPDERLLVEGGVGAPALSGPGGIRAPGEGAPSDGETFDDMIDLERVEGRVRASSVRKVGEIVEKHPDEALSIIRGWMYQEG